MQTNQSDVLKESKRKSTQMELQIRQNQEKKQKSETEKVVWCFFLLFTLVTLDKSIPGTIHKKPGLIVSI